MEVNTKEYRPRTVITLMDGTIGIEISISDAGVDVSIDKYGDQIDFTLDHTTASDILRKVANAVDDWRW